MGSTKKGKIITPSEISTEFSHHDPTVARINNGSFGSCPATVIAAQQRHQLHFLSQPDHHYFHSLKPSLLLSRLSLKSLINASSVSQISLLDNATTAAALVLHHISRLFLTSSFLPGDSAVILHYAYGAVKKSVEAYVAKSGGRVIEAKLPFPIYSDDEIISSFRTALNEAKYVHKSKVRLAVIDHITSMPTVVIPVKKLVQMCRDEGVDYVFVDAAHAIGNVDIDVEDIGADFYTSNLHKWFFCPPSVAFLYSRNPDADLHHPVVSHEYGNGLANESGWIGTRDYSAQLVVPEAVEFVERFEGGIEGIRTRNHERVVEIGEMLVKAWGTNLGSPPEMCSSMVMVGMPVALGIRSDSHCFKLRTHLRECYKIEVPIYFRSPEDGEVDPVTGYARISHQVYNKQEDYLRFRDAVNKLVADGFTCARLL